MLLSSAYGGEEGTGRSRRCYESLLQESKVVVKHLVSILQAVEVILATIAISACYNCKTLDLDEICATLSVADANVLYKLSLTLTFRETCLKDCFRLVASTVD